MPTSEAATKQACQSTRSTSAPPTAVPAAKPAIIGVLIAILVIEPVLLGLAPEVGRYSPFSALPVAAAGLDPSDAGMPDDVDLVAPGLAVVLLLAWIGAAFSAGYATLKLRDLE